MKEKIITGKSKGLVKGDLIYTGAFPGIIISDVHTFAPCCEVWGFEHELGSAYAKDMVKMKTKAWLILAREHGFDGTAYSETARKTIKEMCS